MSTATWSDNNTNKARHEKENEEDQGEDEGIREIEGREEEEETKNIIIDLLCCCDLAIPATTTTAIAIASWGKQGTEKKTKKDVEGMRHSIKMKMENAYTEFQLLLFYFVRK